MLKFQLLNLENAIPGGQLFVVNPRDNLEELKDEVMKDLVKIFSEVESLGVCVKASTLGSLEAFLAFLKSSGVPVAHVGIGPVFRKDVTFAGAMLERKKEFGIILAFRCSNNV